MRRGGAALVLVASLLAGCGGGDDEPVPRAAASTMPLTSSVSTPAVGSSVATATTQAVNVEPVIVERRPPTDAERQRLESERPLTCEHVGGAEWDYNGSSIDDEGPSETSESALSAVVADLDTDGGVRLGRLPESGWLELVDGGSTTFVHAADDWRYLIRFTTDAARPVFRPQSATLCQPDGFIPPTDPPTTTTPTRPPPVTSVPLDGSSYSALGPLIITQPCTATGQAACEEPTALLEGILAVDDGCAVVTDSSSNRVAVFWRFGTSFDAATNEVVGPLGGRLAVGGPVAIGGGGVNTDWLVGEFGTGPPQAWLDCVDRAGGSAFLARSDF